MREQKTVAANRSILPGARVIDYGLFFEKHRTLIVSDFQFGHEGQLIEKGVLLPPTQYKEARTRLEAIYGERGRVQETIIAGDLKHEFGRISEQEWQDILNIVAFMQRNSERVTLVQGNHDKLLGPLAQKRGLEVVMSRSFADVLVLHGDVVPLEAESEEVKTIVIGHEHPAVLLNDGVRREQVKCFLKGKWHGKNLIVLPSFDALTEGTNILREKKLSPFLQGDLGDFEAFVPLNSRETLYFGKLGNL